MTADMERVVVVLLLPLLAEGGAKAVADASVREKATLENFIIRGRMLSDGREPEEGVQSLGW